MTADVFCRFRFEAAHRLANVPLDHKCFRMHGHSYEVIVTVSGEVDPAKGWVRDYAEIADAFNEEVFAKLDHRNLNELLRFLDGNTTSENLASWIRGRLASRLNLGIEGIRVEIWETRDFGSRVGCP